VRRKRPRCENATEQSDEAAPFQLIEFRQVAAIRKARSIPESGDEVRTCAVRDLGQVAVRCGSWSCEKTKTDLVVMASERQIFAFFALCKTTGLKISGAVIPRRVFTQSRSKPESAPLGLMSASTGSGHLTAREKGFVVTANHRSLTVAPISPLSCACITCEWIAITKSANTRHRRLALLE